jgi:uncharacterized protein YerC
MPNRTTTSIEKHTDIVNRLRAGNRYVDIKHATGMSMGTISAINKELRQSDGIAAQGNRASVVHG